MVSINKEKFLNALQSVQAGLSQGDSSCLVFQDGLVVTFNNEVCCRNKSLLPKSFSGAILAKPLIEMLKKYPESELQIDITDTTLILTGVDKVTKKRLEEKVELDINIVETPSEWKEIPEGFDEAIEIVSTCAVKKDDTFQYRTYIHIHPKFIEACDNQQMTRYRIKVPIEKSFVVKKESIKPIISLGVHEFSETGYWLHFRNASGLTISIRKYVEEYPNLSDILSVEGVATVLPSGLQQAADRAALLSKENVDDDNILLELKPGKVRITGKGLTGDHVEKMDLKYNGARMSFLISPKILMEITKNHRDCEICKDKLKVKSDRFTYISCLSAPEIETKKSKE